MDRERLRTLFRYYRQYRWSNIFAMIRNSGREPEICSDDFSGRRVLITGASSGIGRLTALKYASMGADLVCLNRDQTKSAALKEEIERDYGVRCDILLADLSSLQQVHEVAQALAESPQTLDVLIFNAGVYLTGKDVTEEGFERVLAVHYLSYFILTLRLMDKLRSQSACRILIVSSEGHRFAVWGLQPDDLNWQRRRYSGLQSYGSAKLAQLLSMLVFAEKFRGSGVTINAVHPGAVKTQTGKDNGPIYRTFKRHILDRLLKSASVSAEALYYLGAAPALQGLSGKFFHLTTPEEPSPPALDMDKALELWEKTLTITGLHSLDREIIN